MTEQKTIKDPSAASVPTRNQAGSSFVRGGSIQTLQDNEDIVIFQPWGGLGDNLQFSTLPEMFAARGRRVFISSKNVLRNAEIGQLVWNLNPFISGFSDAEPNAGSSVFYNKKGKYYSYIERIEIAHGLVPQNRYPRVYYEPKQRPDASGKILIDLSSISVRH